MIVCINPNLVVQRNDPFTTGIVYMPIGLAYVVASLREANFKVNVIDAFGEKPYHARHNDKFLLLGLEYSEIVARIPADTKAIFVYAINLTNHLSTVEIVRRLKQSYSEIPVIVLENTQAVTAYNLRCVADEFFKAGADYILTGEGEHRAVHLAAALAAADSREKLQQIDGLGSREFYNEPAGNINNLDDLSFPAWDLFPLDSYWNLRFAHGPQTARRYLPILTSRGCPYSCGFCVSPSTNIRKWRARTAQSVVDEMEQFSKKFKLSEFHLEDINPTVSDMRIREICNEILSRGLNIIWKIAAGTKVETIKNEDTIDLMAKAGCRYISISPETGSEHLLTLMRKPFDLEHAVRLVRRMNRTGIRSQACFVLGYPGETEEDLQKTRDMVKNLTRIGIDEVALFIITPVPGSAIYNVIKGYKSLSELNFSPTWRDDYQRLSKYRLHLYRSFLLWKLRYHPLKILRQSFNFLLRKFETKMEMVPYRALVYKYLDLLGKKE